MQNKELEKQVRFFQSSVAQAFAERDNSLMKVFFLLSLPAKSNCAAGELITAYVTFALCYKVHIFSVEIDSVRKQRSEKKQFYKSLPNSRKGTIISYSICLIGTLDLFVFLHWNDLERFGFHTG